MPLTAFSGGTVFGQRVGSGTPRVLGLHGWGRDHRDLLPVLSGFDALAVDLPGFGATPEPEEAWGSAEYAAALHPVLAELESPGVVVGHSFGGRVALRLAATWPELVGALVLTGVPLLGGPTRRPSPAYRLVRRIHGAHLVSDARMERIRRRAGSADYGRASGVMRQVLVRAVNERYEDQLAALACPVELVWGDRDTAAPVASARRAAGLIAEVTLTTCPGADHFGVLSQPTQLRAALARHLPA